MNPSTTKPSLLTWLLPTGVLLAIYLPTLVDLVRDWYFDENYTHGFFVPLISAYIIRSAAKEGLAWDVKHSLTGIWIMAFGMILFVVGTGAAEYFTARVSFVVSVLGLAWYLFGKEWIARTWFAFFFLLFMIPIPYVIYYALSVPMQLLASKVTGFLLNELGMGVVRQGNIIHLAGGYSLEVVEACSGIRSLVSLLALGAIYAYWTQKYLGTKILLFVSTVPIAVFANVVRVFFTALIASTLTQAITEEPWHTLMGLSVFVIAFVCLVIEGWLLRKVWK